MIVFCFSATGNSLSVARHIARTQADSRIIGIREALETPSAVWEDDAIGVVTPTHTGRMPAPVERFFETADIRTDYLFVVYTCGVTPGLGVNIACRQARRRGLQVAYANSIKMVDNNFMLYDVRRQIETADAKDIPHGCHCCRYCRSTSLYCAAIGRRSSYGNMYESDAILQGLLSSVSVRHGALQRLWHLRPYMSGGRHHSRRGRTSGMESRMHTLHRVLS